MLYFLVVGVLIALLLPSPRLSRLEENSHTASDFWSFALASIHKAPSLIDRISVPLLA
jgi:hypothetical protein